MGFEGVGEPVPAVTYLRKGREPDHFVECWAHSMVVRETREDDFIQDKRYGDTDAAHFHRRCNGPQGVIRRRWYKCHSSFRFRLHFFFTSGAAQDVRRRNSRY